ncbi:hypothetical protein [uncultured Treponema sp.]|uniref:hypothetical protein n=1 Tax=uncultured Treponema sp. TaxID=162155 RepID=UPI0025EA48CE|nr:hypothetical protein [uncultured Treponema sp.]
MKKKWELFFGAVFLSIFSFTFSGCESMDTFACPYIISNPRVELGECEKNHKFAGMHFSFFNESKKDIENFTLCFMLYDSDGNNPFIGSNCIVSRCDWKVRSGAVVDFIIDLDSYLTVVPTEPYQLDYIFVCEINYSDKSCWKDPYGMYCVREACE